MSKHQTCMACLADFVGPDNNIGRNLCPTCDENPPGDFEHYMLSCGNLRKKLAQRDALIAKLEAKPYKCNTIIR